MSNLRLLLLSNSKNYGGQYLQHAKGTIKEFLGSKVKTVLFVPFAGVRTSFDDYASTVRPHFEELGYKLVSIHETGDYAGAVKDAEAIAVGGGNTFHLLKKLYDTGLLEVIRSRSGEGMPFIG